MSCEEMATKNLTSPSFNRYLLHARFLFIVALIFSAIRLLDGLFLFEMGSKEFWERIGSMSPHLLFFFSFNFLFFCMYFDSATNKLKHYQVTLKVQITLAAFEIIGGLYEKPIGDLYGLPLLVALLFILSSVYFIRLLNIKTINPTPESPIKEASEPL